MTKYLFGFEGGANGATVATTTAGAGDRPWDAVTVGAGATITHDTSVKAVGSASGKIVGSTAQTVTRWTLPSTHTQGRLRFYLRLNSLPSSNLTVARLSSAASTQTAQVTILTTGAVVLYGQSNGSGSANNSGSAVLTPGTWYEIELAYTVGASGTLRVGVYTLDGATFYTSPTVTVNTGADPVGVLHFGQFNTSTAALGTFWVDGVELDDAATGIAGPSLPALPTPVVTLGAKTTSSGSNGTQTVTWPAVSGAVSYEAWRASGSNPAQGDFTLVQAGVTSPFTFTGLAAGTYSYGIKAKA